MRPDDYILWPSLLRADAKKGIQVIGVTLRFVPSFQAKNWDQLNENIIQLTKKRGQLKAAVTKMVQVLSEFFKNQFCCQAHCLRLVRATLS